MSVQQMRVEITKVYKGERWRLKVLRMTDNQVIAVYHRFVKDGLIKNY
jgi:hypothetical protein